VALVFGILLTSSLSMTSSNEITSADYYLTNKRGEEPHWQYLLNSTQPTSTTPSKIIHPGKYIDFIWRTDFQPAGLNFSSGSWSFNLWLEINQSSFCKLSYGFYFLNFGAGYFGVTEPQVFDLDQIGIKEYTFTFTGKPALSIPPGWCFAFQLNASAANLYLDSTDMHSGVHFTSGPITTTTETPTTTVVTTQPGSQTSEATTSQQSTSPTASVTSSASSSTSETQISTSGTTGTFDHFSLTVHAHPKEFQYPSEPPDELNTLIVAEYSRDGVKKAETKETLFTLEVDRGSAVNLTVSSFPSNSTWIEWDNYGTGRTSGTYLTVQMNSDKTAIAYFSVATSTSSATTTGVGVVYVVPGFSAPSTFGGLLLAAAIVSVVRMKRYRHIVAAPREGRPAEAATRDRD